MSDWRINADTKAYIEFLEKRTIRLQESLKAVIAAYEQAGYIMGKQPDAITQVLIDAKQTLKETE